MDALISSALVWVAVATAVSFFYWYGTSTFSYFKDQGVPGPKPLPYVGTSWGIWKRNLPKYDKELSRKYGKIFGHFDGTIPNLYTTDAELIKSVFVKDFDHFINRRDMVVSMKIVRKMMSIIQNQQWKDVRSSITPAFTTGQIKRMSALITECAERLVIKFKILVESQGKINAKEQFSAFTMDVIARCAFGMTIDTLGEKDDPFLKKAKEVFSPPVNKSPLVLLIFLFPRLLTNYGERLFFAVDGFQFFIKVLQDLVKERANSSEKYHDFVEVATETILEYTKEVDGKQVPMWDREEVDEIVIAQSVLFLLAGFETTATTLTNASVLLARNPHVQEKLYKEIAKRFEKFGEVNHEMILNFPYIDHVINEVLRMYPPILRVERGCNKDIVYNSVSIKKGTIVTVPTFALHYDEEYYPEPNKFNPDRWDPESEIKPNPYTFMPFGMGPRNCIGMRFSMEEMKIALCTIVKNFRFFPVEGTPEEIEFEDGFLISPQMINSTVGIESR